MNEVDALASLSALANKSRLAVVRELVKAGQKGMSAGDIAIAIGASPSQTSFHLSALSDGGLVTSERDTRRIIYRTNFETFAALVGYLFEDCCGGDARVKACC